jgi:hypothetical protein
VKPWWQRALAGVGTLIVLLVWPLEFVVAGLFLAGGLLVTDAWLTVMPSTLRGRWSILTNEVPAILAVAGGAAAFAWSDVPARLGVAFALGGALVSAGARGLALSRSLRR